MMSPQATANTTLFFLIYQNVPVLSEFLFLDSSPQTCLPRLAGLCALRGRLHQAVSGSESFSTPLAHLLNCSDLFAQPVFVHLGGVPEERCVRGHRPPLPEGQQAGGRGLQQPGDGHGQAHPEHF